MARPSRPRPEREREPSVPAPRPRYDPLLDALAHHGAGRHVEQLSWRWHGPLDTHRFTAAWQSVTDHQTVLRSAVEAGPPPRPVVHAHTPAEVLRHPAGTVDWDELLEQDRLRGIDPHRPGPLRVTLVDGPGGTIRVLLTFHHALLDAWSVSLLLDSFYRAYLAGGALPGGERRPDLRDWARWLDRQDTAPARDFWTRVIPATPPVVLPVLPATAAQESGHGRARTCLTPTEAAGLHHWAAHQAVPDSSVLQAVWALLLYRAEAVNGPLTVGFGVTVSGRGIPLDAVERLPGPLRSQLPMVLPIDPGQPVHHLLTDLRDRALDMAPYEWVSPAQVHEWTGHTESTPLLATLVAVESAPHAPAPLTAAALATEGIRIEPLHATGAPTTLPLSLSAHPTPAGALTLTAVHDRARLSSPEATRLLTHYTHLLRTLPTNPTTITVAEALSLLPTAD